jgi:ribosomal protein L40E
MVLVFSGGLMVTQLLIFSQVVAQSAESEPAEYILYAIVIAVFLAVALAFGHLSGKRAASAGGNYWLFAPLGFFFGIFGYTAAVIYSAVVRSTQKKRSSTAVHGAHYPPGYAQGHPPIHPQAPPYPEQPVQAPRPEPGPTPVAAQGIFQDSDFVPNPPMRRSSQEQPEGAESQNGQASRGFLQPKIPPWEQTAPAPSGLRTCAGCGADNPGRSTLCWRCGQKLDVTGAARRCPQCNTVLEPLADYCPKCGTHLSIG